jgi:hypothetical protein
MDIRVEIRNARAVGASFAENSDCNRPTEYNSRRGDNGTARIEPRIERELSGDSSRADVMVLRTSGDRLASPRWQSMRQARRTRRGFVVGRAWSS